MKLKRASAIALAFGIFVSGSAYADKPADDFLNPQDMGPRLSFMTLIGPGFRANYDHRWEIEKDVTELRTQLIGDVVFPYSEISAHADLRLFLLTFGASAGYHNEWHLLQFQPNYDIEQAGLSFGRDNVNRRQQLDVDGNPIGPFGFSNLTRAARQVKDQEADVQTDRWTWYEGRLGFIWPAQNFLVSSTAGLRNEDRPDVSFDWANATVLNGGFHLRWESYFFFRDPKLGFLGPALRIMNVPRNRLSGGLINPNVDPNTVLIRSDSACQEAPGIPCKERREWELQYGFIGGLRTNWVTSNDTFLTRVFTTYGLNNELFGMHILGQPIQLLFAYSVEVEL